MNYKTEKSIIIFLTILFGVSFFLDNLIILFFNIIQTPVLNKLFYYFSDPFLAFLLMMLFTTYFLYKNNKIEAIKPLWVSFVIAILVTYILKFIIQRPRPLDEIHLILGFIDYSFPSTHAAVAFSIFSVIEEEFKKIKYFWLFYAILVVLSRLYFSVHHFSDIVFGALIGYLIGIIIVKHQNKINKIKIPFIK